MHCPTHKYVKLLLTVKKQIDEANAALEVLRQENQLLKEQTESKDAKILIEQLTEGLPVTKKRHLEKVFSGKSAKFINENFQYTLDMFDKTEAEKLTTLKEDATAGKKIAERPTVEKKQVVQESVESQIEQSNPGNMQDTGLFNNYMGELNKW